MSWHGLPKTEMLSTYTLSALPGGDDCAPDVVVSHNVWVNDKVRGMGIGQANHLERLTDAKLQDYKYILCTVNATNGAEIHILQKNGWKLLDTFTGHSGDDIHLYGRTLV